MTITAEELKGQLALLSVEERAELAAFLIGSLDEAQDQEAESAWDMELTRRNAEIESGSVAGVPAEEVMASLRKRFW